MKRGLEFSECNFLHFQKIIFSPNLYQINLGEKGSFLAKSLTSFKMAAMSNETDHSLPPFMTAKTAGKVLGYFDGSSITKLCRAGKIPGAYREGPSWFIPREWVLAKKKADEAAGVMRDGKPGRKATTGAGLQRRDRGGPGGDPYHIPTGRPPGRPPKQ